MPLATKPERAACSRRSERVERRVELVGGDALTGIPDPEIQACSSVLDVDRNRRRLRAVLHSVQYDIRDRLREPPQIAVHAKPGSRHVDRHRPISELRSQHFERPVDDLRELDHARLQLHRAARKSRDVQEIIDDLRQTADGTLHELGLA
jgi:hypothetical protein